MQQGSKPGKWVNQEPDVIHILVEAEEAVAVGEESLAPARPHRNRQLPKYLQDYDCS